MVVHRMGPALQDCRLDDRNRAFEIRLAVGALAFEANLAFLLQSVQGVGGAGEVFGVGSEIAVVEIIDVDKIAIEILQRLLALMANVEGIICVFGGAGEMADLGGNDLLL